MPNVTSRQRRSVTRRSIPSMALLAVALPAAPLLAQRPLSIGIGGGLSMPVQDLRDGANTGWHALGTIALGAPMHPLGLRLDATYNRFAYTDRLRTALGGSGYQSVGSATLNVSYRLPMTDAPLAPYLISGLGAYRTSCSLGPGCEGATSFGWNAGLGARLYLLGLRSFLEARYHRTENDGRYATFFPATLGFMF